MLSVTRVTTRPITIAMRQYRSSLATDTVEGESSIECLISKFVKATECRTPMSERSIVFSKVARWHLQRLMLFHKWPLKRDGQ